MQSPYSRAAERVLLYGCCKNPLPKPAEQHDAATVSSNSKSTSATCRQGFAAITNSSFFPNTQFTNHENLPSLLESFGQFTKAYPKYSETSCVDKIRAQEYYHLSFSNHVCLDYIGIGLFSYAQVQSQFSPQVPAASSSSPPQRFSDSPFFSLSCKSVNLKSQLVHGGQEAGLESVIKKRIMEFLHISLNDYCMVFTANKSSAFKLVAESYPFQSSRKLLTVYDYENEALKTMVSASEKRGAKIMSAEFKWPRFRVQSVKLRKMIVRKKKRKKQRGLFVIPLQSRMTGTSYSYQWMSLAQENGWHVLLDCCALGPKDMDSFGLSLFRPDFLVCSFYKVTGENPTGFGCLFVKKSTTQILEDSSGTGIVNLVPGKRLALLSGDSSGSDTQLENKSTLEAKTVEMDSASQPTQSEKEKPTNGDSSVMIDMNIISKAERLGHPEKWESEKAISLQHNISVKQSDEEEAVAECRCLDHIDSLGLMLISSRGRYLINWLVTALMKFQHPNRLDHFPLVRIYGPKVKFDRGPALSFNIYDWKGEKVEPALVQKLADRNNISLSTGFLQNIWFSDKQEQEKEKVLERRQSEESEKVRSKTRNADQGITVVTIAISFLANFEDVYRLWVFIAQFLDADFVEKERWRYTAIDQKTVEV